jgi:hypothetical protein
MCSFHWILLVIKIDSSRLLLFNMRRPRSDKQPIIDALNKLVQNTVYFSIFTKPFPFFESIKHQIYTFNFYVHGMEKISEKASRCFLEELDVRSDFPVCVCIYREREFRYINILCSMYA